MTNIHLCVSRQTLMLVIAGHAGYRSGEDIVCAAVSILGQAAAGMLIDMSSDGVLNVKVERKDGFLKVIAGYPDGMQKEMESRMELAKTGFLMLEYTYPDHVKFHFDAVQTKKEELC